MFSFQLRFATIIEELSSPHFGGKYIFHNPGEIDQEKVLKYQKWIKKIPEIEEIHKRGSLRFFGLQTTQPTQQAILEVEFTFQFLIEF